MSAIFNMYFCFDHVHVYLKEGGPKSQDPTSSCEELTDDEPKIYGDAPAPPDHLE